MAKPESSRKSQKGAAGKLPDRPSLDPRRNYSRQEAILVCGISKSALARALSSRELGCYRIRRRVIISGRHLLIWMRRREQKAKGGAER